MPICRKNWEQFRNIILSKDQKNFPFFRRSQNSDKFYNGHLGEFFKCAGKPLHIYQHLQENIPILLFWKKLDTSKFSIQLKHVYEGQISLLSKNDCVDYVPSSSWCKSGGVIKTPKN